MSTNSNKYWNSRGYEKAPLSSEAPLLAKIRNGDYNLSYYQVMATREKLSFAKTEAELKQHFNGSAQDWEEAIAPYRREHFVKIQALYAKAQADELKKLNDFRTELCQTFGHDYWEELTPLCDGGPMELYKMYKQKANTQLYARAQVHI